MHMEDDSCVVKESKLLKMDWNCRKGKPWEILFDEIVLYQYMILAKITEIILMKDSEYQ